MNYVDYDVAIKYTYSKEILDKAIKRFLLEYINFDIKIIDATDSETLLLIHKLKGITLNLGAIKLYDRCIEMENTKDFKKDIKDFIYTFNKTYKELLDF